MEIAIADRRDYTLADLPQGAVPIPRTASALTAMEVADAISTQIARIVEHGLGMGPVKAGDVHDQALKVLQRDSRLGKIHLTYPRISWSGTVARWDSPEAIAISWAVEIKPATRPNDWFKIYQLADGMAGGVLIQELEFGQLMTDKPDEIRRRFGLPIRCQYSIAATGQTITVLIPADLEFSPGGHLTAAAQRMAKVVPPMGAAPPVPPGIDTRGQAPAVLTPTELVAEPPPIEPTAAPAPSPSIAKSPPVGLKPGGTRRSR